jgi:hypothetical protein
MTGEEDPGVRENLVTRKRKADELATPEELAAREARTGPVHDQTPAEALSAAHDRIADDELAARIGAHPDRDIFLALWRRILGDVVRDAEQG